MKTYKIEIQLKSPSLIASGEGYGAVIDSDVVFDDFGIPYIPAKRLKGCLKDSAKEISEMFSKSNIDIKLAIDETFGSSGNLASLLNFSNLQIEEYEKNKEYLNYFIKEHSDLVSKEAIINYFTEIRQQTTINEETGVSQDKSLRTIRVLKKGFKFIGDVNFQEDNEEILRTLAFACINLKHIGTKRTRGFGEIECKLLEDFNEKYLKELGEKCGCIK